MEGGGGSGLIGTMSLNTFFFKASSKQIRAIPEVEVEIFLFKSKFLGFVEAPVGLFAFFSFELLSLLPVC